MALNMYSILYIIHTQQLGCNWDSNLKTFGEKKSSHSEEKNSEWDAA
jgi:hypothetical protein